MILVSPGPVPVPASGYCNKSVVRPEPAWAGPLMDTGLRVSWSANPFERLWPKSPQQALVWSIYVTKGILYSPATY